MTLSRRNLLLGAAAVGAASLAPAAAWAAPAHRPMRRNGSIPITPLQLFASDTFNGEALFALGGASSRSAEVGEVLRIAQEINATTGNPADDALTTEAFDAYVDAFGSFGDRLETLATQSTGVTSRDRYLRASTYAAQQVFFVLGTSDGSRELALFNTAQRRWMRAVRQFSPAVRRFSVPSPFGPIPGYLLKADPGPAPRPTVIISEGSDGQNVETMQFGVTAALDRGYNVILFEGPGQMSLLFRRQIPFTADWQQVVRPVAQWARRRRDVGALALIGISFGGMLCSRAAARVRELDAVVLEPGAYDFTLLWSDQENMNTVKETHDLPPDEKEQARNGLNQGFLEAWPNIPKVNQFEIYKRGEIFKREVQDEARAGVPISDYYQLLETMLPFRYEDDFRAITIPTMVTYNEGDQFFGDQPRGAFELLENVPTARKEFVELTAAQGASMHDQPVGPQVAQEIVFDWLTDQLR